MITVVPTVDTAVAQPRIRLTVTGDSTSPNPVGPSDVVTMYRTDPDGRKKKVISVTGSQLSGGSWTGYDYHAPFNQTVSYSAAISIFNSPAASAMLPSTVSWLIHPTNPLKSVQVAAVNEIADIVQASTAVLSRPFGSSTPISISEGVRESNSSSVTVRVTSQTMLAQVQGLLADSGPILLNLAGQDAGSGWWDEDWAWIQPGDTQIVNVGKNIAWVDRHVVIPYTVIDTPAGVAVPIWTVLNVANAYPTVAAAAAAYATVGAMTTNTTGSPATGSLIPDPASPGLYLPGALVPDPSNPGLYLVPS